MVQHYEMRAELYENRCEALHNAAMHTDMQRNDLFGRLKGRGHQLSGSQRQSDRRCAHAMSALSQKHHMEAVDTAARSAMLSDELIEMESGGMGQHTYGALRRSLADDLSEVDMNAIGYKDQAEMAVSKFDLLEE